MCWQAWQQLGWVQLLATTLGAAPVLAQDVDKALAGVVRLKDGVLHSSSAGGAGQASVV